MFEEQIDWDISSFGSKELLDCMPGGSFIYYVDNDQFLYVSQNMLDMLGYTEQTFRDKFNNRFSELVYIQDREATLSTIVNQISGSSFDTCIYRIEKADGTLMWVKDEGHLVTTSSGRECFFVVIIDITELNHQNLVYRNKNQKEYDEAMQQLLLSNPNAICAYKLNLTQNTCSNCHGASDYITKLIDAKTVDELVQRVALIMYDDYSTKWFISNISREHLLKKYAGGERDLTVSYRRMRENGNPTWVKSFLHMLENPKTHDIEVIVYSIDVNHSSIEEKIFSRICEEFYDCFGLIEMSTGKVKYYYGSNDLKDIDLKDIKKNLETKEVYCIFSEEKQINFFYFDDLEEYVIFSQIDMNKPLMLNKDHKKLRKYSSIEGINSRVIGEEKINEILEKTDHGCFFIFDIDDFKITIDTFGRRVADRILHNFAKYLELFFDKNDLLYRLASDRFAVFAPNINTIEKASEKLDRIFYDIKDVRVEGQTDLLISISAGAHIRTEKNESYEDIYSHAEKQMLIVKNNGKGSFLIN